MIMNIIRHDPFRELRGLQDEMTRLFAGMSPSGREDSAFGAWQPNVDIFEDKDKLVLEAELPGMNREDFDLTVENNVITLTGERKFEKRTDGENYHRVERSYGNFSRSFTLPQTVDTEGVKADFKDGILTVSLPKREETKARKIDVSYSHTDTKTIEAQPKSSEATA
jgi:HSP20 family protein